MNTFLNDFGSMITGNTIFMVCIVLWLGVWVKVFENANSESLPRYTALASWGAVFILSLFGLTQTIFGWVTSIWLVYGFIVVFALFGYATSYKSSK